MRMRSLVLLLVVAAGCGKKQPEAAPAPDTGAATPSTPAPPPPPPSTRPTTDPGAAERERAEVLAWVQDPIYFEFNEDAIRADAQTNLERKAAVMLANPALRIRISGHADERGSDEYNLVLGTKRATAAKRYLESRGIDGGRIEIISYGEERPAAQGSSEDAWARNRRDEFEITAGGDRLVKPR